MSGPFTYNSGVTLRWCVGDQGDLTDYNFMGFDIVHNRSYTSSTLRLCDIHPYLLPFR